MNNKKRLSLKMIDGDKSKKYSSSIWEEHFQEWQTKPTIIFCHTQPDGDTIASMLALFHILRKSNPNIKCGFTKSLYNKWPLHIHLHFQQEFDGLIPLDFLEEGFNNYEKYNAIMVDFHDIGFADNLNIKRCKNHFAIDHHPYKSNETHNSNKMIIDPDVPANCLVLFRFLCEFLKFDVLVKDTKFINTIVKGIITDTGSFSFKNVDTEKIYGLVQTFLDKNKKFSISDLLMRNKGLYYEDALKALALNKWACENLKIQSKSIFLVISQEQSKILQLTNHPQPLIAFLNSLADFEGVFLAHQQTTGLWKIHLRSKNKSIRQIATFYNSGVSNDFAGGFLVENSRKISPTKIKKILKQMALFLEDEINNKLIEFKT